MGGVVPEVWQEACKPFMDDIPPRDFDTVVLPTIEEELGGKQWSEVFSFIDKV
jgi:hypothetical protein